MSRTKSRLDTEAELIMFIFVAGFAWTHKDTLLKAANIVIPVLAFAFIAILSIMLFKKLRFRRRLKTSSMSLVDKMSGTEFEQYLAKKLRELGYANVKLTERYDYGVDIIATKESIVWGIQAKRYSGLVKADAVRQIVAGLKKYNCDKAMVITNSYFSNVAKELATLNNCKLLDRSDLHLIVD